MANHHYGDFGDVFKHLVLSEMLSTQLPAIYMESHAGSARYPLIYDHERKLGIGHFLNCAGRSLTLCQCAWYRLFFPDNEATPPDDYPGSMLIAMKLLGDRTKRFIGCDIDPASVDSLKAAGREMGFNDGQMALVTDDGYQVINQTLDKLSAEHLTDTFLLIDPFQLRDGQTDSSNATELFCKAASRGVQTLLWFGFDNSASGKQMLHLIDQNFTRANVDMIRHNIWSGIIRPHVIDQNSDAARQANIIGCGVVCANISPTACCLCEILGEEMAALYQDAEIEDGHTLKSTFQYQRRGMVNISDLPSAANS